MWSNGESGRRDALRALLAAGVATVAAPSIALPAAWLQSGDEPVPFTDIPADFSVRRPNAPPEAPPFRLDLRQIAWLTPNEQFFAVAHYGMPRVVADAWRLHVEGAAARSFSLTLDELKGRPRVERTVTFECSGNRVAALHGMVGNARWTGTPLRELLLEARPVAEVKEVIFWAADRGKETIRGAEYEQHFARSLALDEAMSSGAILAWEMNGQPLDTAHGYPVRLIVPGWYGIANVKWLERIELSATRLMGRFMARDYVTIAGRPTERGIEWLETPVGPGRLKSVVARLARTGQRLRVLGAAWSDGTPLAVVEVRLDDGDWQAARLERQPNPYAWTFFSLETELPRAGEHAVVSRARDAKGRTQPDNLDLKKTYWEDNAQFVRTFRIV